MTLFWILAGIAGAAVLEKILGGQQVLVSTGPAGAGAASGSIRSDTWSHNRFGMYVRNRTIPVNPNTDRQVSIRATLAELTTRWAQTLTAVQRTAWNLYGASVVMKNKIGQDIFLTGFNHFLRSNIERRNQGDTPVDAGPVLFELPNQDGTLAAAFSEATQILTITFNDALAWCSEDDAALLVYQGQPQNAQRNFFGGPWRFVRWIAGNVGVPVTSPQDCTCAFAVAQGQRDWAYARILRADGRLSEPFRSDAIVGA